MSRAPADAPTGSAAAADTQPGYRFSLRRFFGWLPVYLAVAFCLYALSAGPIYWTIFSAYHLETSPLLTILYLPLVWLSGYVEWFGRWMDWYVGLWVL